MLLYSSPVNNHVEFSKNPLCVRRIISSWVNSTSLKNSTVTFSPFTHFTLYPFLDNRSWVLCEKLNSGFSPYNWSSIMACLLIVLSSFCLCHTDMASNPIRIITITVVFPFSVFQDLGVYFIIYTIVFVIRLV